MDSLQDRLTRQWTEWRERWALADHNLVFAGIFLLFILLQLFLGWYWSREPAPFAVGLAESTPARPGVVLTQTLVQVSSTLLDKPGGYLRNDMLPPGLFLDNMPAWELGALRQVRDMSRSLHRDLGLSHAQFIEDRDLAEAEASFNANSDSWAFPAAEGEIRRGAEALQRYGKRLQQGQPDAQFYARREYLLRWLGDVDGHLGQLSSRLNAALPDHPSVMRARPGETPLPHAEETSWWDVDDVFYESRGSAWALMHLLKAVEVDFGPELARQQAQLSLRAAIHELEATQQAVWSPVILNGSGFGLFANHSLVMANYLSRARTDLADVRALLQDAD